MLCGLIRLVSRIKLWHFVRKADNWECNDCCIFCKWADLCMVEKEAEEE